MKLSYEAKSIENMIDVVMKQVDSTTSKMVRPGKIDLFYCFADMSERRVACENYRTTIL